MHQACGQGRLLFKLGPVVGRDVLQRRESGNQIADRDLTESRRRLGRVTRTVGPQRHGNTVLQKDKGERERCGPA